MLDTAGDGEPLLCINESQWAYGTKIHFVKQAGKGVGGGWGGGNKESHLADQKRLGPVFCILTITVPSGAFSIV